MITRTLRDSTESSAIFCFLGILNGTMNFISRHTHLSVDKIGLTDLRYCKSKKKNVSQGIKDSSHICHYKCSGAVLTSFCSSKVPKSTRGDARKSCCKENRNCIQGNEACKVQDDYSAPSLPENSQIGGAEGVFACCNDKEIKQAGNVDQLQPRLEFIEGYNFEVSSIAIPCRESAGNSEDLGGYLGGGVSKVE
jgi:hypothetical protein